MQCNTVQYNKLFNLPLGIFWPNLQQVHLSSVKIYNRNVLTKIYFFIFIVWITDIFHNDVVTPNILCLSCRLDVCSKVNCSSPPYSSCQANGLVPKCVCPDDCSNDVRPVCGTDGKTYDNECKLRRYACINGFPIRVKEQGRCGTCPYFTL